MTKRPQLDTLFPDPATVSAGRRARRVRKAFAAVGVLVLLSGGVGIAQAASAAPLAYRTAAVGDHDVQSLLTTVGTVQAVSQAAVGFPVSGTVATVDVAVGDKVVVGQSLATLDSTGLTEALHTKQAALAQAELTLSKALNGESTTSTGSGATGSTSSAPTGSSAAAAATATTAPTTTAPTTTTNSDAIEQAQQAVVDAQQAVDSALTQANQALAAADTVCADLDATLAALDSSTSTTTTAVAPTTAATAVVDTASCHTALAAVRTAQSAAATAQQQLSSAATTLDDLLAQSVGTASTNTATTNTAPTNAASTTTPSTNTASTTTASTNTASTTSTVSSEELIADQKAVDAAAVDVVAAQQALNQDVLIAPIAGTVIAVSLATGDSVTAASSTAVITIVGDGGYEVTTTVSVDDVTDLAVGQSAAFLVDGSSDDLAGEIVSIGVAPASGSTSYPVTIALASPDADLQNGATGTVSIVTAATSSALSVPTSAVTTDGDRHTVTVLSGTTTEDVTVEVGVVGDTWTQITSGVAEGDEVVLAALDEALPGSATDTGSSGTSAGTNGGSGGAAGGFTGGPPAGFTGGPPAG